MRQKKEKIIFQNKSNQQKNYIKKSKSKQKQILITKSDPIVKYLILFIVLIYHCYCYTHLAEYLWNSKRLAYLLFNSIISAALKKLWNKCEISAIDDKLW